LSNLALGIIGQEISEFVFANQAGVITLRPTKDTRYLVNLAPSWAAKTRQWWDELVTGRHERTLKEQVSKLENELYAARAEADQLRKTILLYNPMGRDYIRSTQPLAPVKSMPYVPQTWADLQEMADDGDGLRKETAGEAAAGK
jgi:hypothetical protein